MAAQNIDLVDEDAADLQFPKDCTMTSETDFEERFSDTCYICGMWLREPYITCVDCKNTLICTKCFASGGERNNHYNYHKYSVIRNEFPLLGNWTAKEELALLEAMIEFGADNWTDIAKKVSSRCEEECMKHYFWFYSENSDLQLQVGETFSSHRVETAQQTVMTPFSRYVSNSKKISDFEGPDDHAQLSKNSYSLKLKLNPYLKQQQQLYQRADLSRPLFECRATQFIPGYNAARGEFSVEFDDSAELMVAELDSEIADPEDNDYEVLTDMQVAIVEAYNGRLRERKRRKQIIRHHGLLLLQKTIGWLQRFEGTIGREIAEKLTGLMRVLNGKKFDFLMESLHAMGETRAKIKQLKELRDKGITSHRANKLYAQLSDLRNQVKKDGPILSGTFLPWSGANAPAVPIQTSAPRKKPPPLDIMTLPGYEKLTPSERELCSNLRLAPLSFLDFRDILVTESRRNPGSSLKLAQARVLIKIDVNKTRKLYDFLLNEGYFTQGT
ncbi:transcriptional adapter 2-alpha-like isoform X1 [Frankliniella occidentalis]|uniref:Transcriptional adapter 2-alpha-like isoform X1 n=1 Tax=Frankliniella occidentalis TaxID=133901 RepID=A0A6J1SVD4_FRAOC|nr:transcriptional adapter 2-alpha-like isoform X1 [Frankliniella occidentalis]